MLEPFLFRVGDCSASGSVGPGGQRRMSVWGRGAGALVGLLAVSIRPYWLGGEKRDFENTVPLTDPEATLPTPRESMRRSFAVPAAVLVALSSLLFGLFWDFWGIGWGFSLVPERIIRGVYAFFWERRHGVLLW
ncbi:hypothetical protein [Streptomyces sp. NPDC058751]|uniref:hypothetical protein n=1 Tax=Streptomyces sp. NPDC058751 TaxID=3346623 RepID=UPI0036999966